MSKNNKSNTVSINKGMFAIIVILVALLAMFAIDVVAIYMSDTKTLTSKINNTLSDASKNNSNDKKCNSSISLDNKIELNNLIDNDLVVLLYKEKLSDLTDLELRTIATIHNNIDIKVTNENSDDVSYSFASDELKKAFNNSVFSELKYEDGNIGGYCAGIVSDINIYLYDNSTKIYTANPNTGMGCNSARPYVYTYNVDSYKTGDKYVIVNQYLFGNASNIVPVEESKYLFGSVSKGTDTSKSVATLDNIGEEDTSTTLFMDALEKFTSDYKNYDNIKDKLDTYTYTFEKKDGHFVITDFSVEHSK